MALLGDRLAACVGSEGDRLAEGHGHVHAAAPDQPQEVADELAQLRRANSDNVQWSLTQAEVEVLELQETINGQKTTGTKVIPLLGDECQNKLNEQVLTNKYIDALKELASKPGNVIITDGKTVPMVNIPAPTK